MSEFLASIFGSDIWGEIGDWFTGSAASADGKGVMSSNLMSSVMSAIGGVGKMGAMSQMSHPHATSTAFHYQSNANPNQITQQLPSLMKNDINVNSGLQAMRGMKW